MINGPIKQSEEDKKVIDQMEASHRATQSEIRQYVERWERLESDKKDISDHQKEVMSEAKGRGYNVAALKVIIAKRAKDKDKLAELEADVMLYEEAMGNG